VCEDGGEGAFGHLCAWGSDCQDCGSRNLTFPARAVNNAIVGDIAFDLGYGIPTQLEYEKAYTFMCGGSNEGRRCNERLVDLYTTFHGDSNLYTSIARSVCLDRTCSLDGLLQYELSDGSDAICCFAAQTVALYVLQHVFDVDVSDLSVFDTLCENDLDVASQLGFSCVEVSHTASLETSEPSFHTAGSQRMLASAQPVRGMGGSDISEGLPFAPEVLVNGTYLPVCGHYFW
jgi:hypothetical protein